MRLESTGWREVLSDDAPLMRRGWALQERLLAPRLLHYGQQMYWECRHCMWSEDEQFDQTLDNHVPFNKNVGKRPAIRQSKGQWQLSRY